MDYRFNLNSQKNNNDFIVEKLHEYDDNTRMLKFLRINGIKTEDIVFESRQEVYETALKTTPKSNIDILFQKYVPEQGPNGYIKNRYAWNKRNGRELIIYVDHDKFYRIAKPTDVFDDNLKLGIIYLDETPKWSPKKSKDLDVKSIYSKGDEM